MPPSTDNCGWSSFLLKRPLNRSRQVATPIVAWAALVAGGLLTTTLLSTSLLVGAEPASAYPVPNGLPDLVVPADNPLTAEKIALGKQLYFDPRLSADNTVSCATCHDPAKGYSNGDQFATGVGGKKGGRNSPTVINAAYQAFQFWDGRAKTLEDQALGPVANPIEMNLPLPEMEKRLRAIPGYKAQFLKIFGREPVAADVAKVIACYERTILSGDAPYDRFVAGDTKALSEAAQRGWKLFNGKANCAACHSGPNFTDNAFHNIGIGMASDHPDTGREAISKMEGDFGSFKTPGLREIARTGPYMHDGSVKTLKDVIEHYNRGGTPNAALDEEMFPLKLTDAEKADLVTFMEEALSSPSYPNHTAPELPK